MMDEDGHFEGVVKKELEEETGITIDDKKLEYLTSIHPSAGGCDEYVKLFLYKCEMDE